MSAFTKLDPVLPAFIEALNEMTMAYYKRDLTFLYESGRVPSYTIDFGKKYVRIVVGRNTSQSSVYCFLDADGNILKSESWKKPAKGIRGSIFDPGFSIGKGLTQYGAVYYR